MSEPGRTGPFGARVRVAGILVLALAFFLPFHGCVASPREFESPGPLPSYFKDGASFSSPLSDLRSALGPDPDPTVTRPPLARLWSSLPLFPYLLLPFWAAALLARRRWGTPGAMVLLALSLALWAALAWHLWNDFRGFGPDGLRVPEAIGFAVAAGAVLFLRRRGHGGWRDPAAAVSAQALFGLAYYALFPGGDFLEWTFDEGHAAWASAAAVLWNYRIGCWLTLAGLAMAASPGYFSEEALRSLYPRALPWPSRSSTPTPTSTSTGSTPTGRTSTPAPAPPDSSRW